MTIPYIEEHRVFTYHCSREGCQSIHEQKAGARNADGGGHYTNSCPPSWLNITVSNGDTAPEHKLLCSNCTHQLRSALRDLGFHLQEEDTTTEKK